MKTKTLVFGTTTILALGSVAAGYETAGAVFLVGGVLIWCIHAVEVKVNRLLDDRGITVDQDEIAR